MSEDLAVGSKSHESLYFKKASEMTVPTVGHQGRQGNELFLPASMETGRNQPEFSILL